MRQGDVVRVPDGRIGVIEIVYPGQGCEIFICGIREDGGDFRTLPMSSLELIGRLVVAAKHKDSWKFSYREYPFIEELPGEDIIVPAKGLFGIVEMRRSAIFRLRQQKTL